MTPRVFRSHESGSVYRLDAIGLFAIIATIPVLTDRPIVGGLIFGAPFLGAYLLMGRSRVETDVQGVKVINPFRVHEIAWKHVERFELDRNRLGTNDQGYLVARDQRLPMFAVQSSNAFFRSRNAGEKGLIDELNQVLVEARREGQAG